jgi:hypothetical protein
MTTQVADAFSRMLEGGVLEPSVLAVASTIFGQEDFTLAVLHAHLLVEKGLNACLTEKGIPSVLLGSGGLEFHQKYKAYDELRGHDARRLTLFEILNTLRNNVAHDFWDDGECIRSAWRRAFPKKSQRKIVEDAAAMGVDAVKLVFIMLALEIGILQALVVVRSEAAVVPEIDLFDRDHGKS